MDAVRAVVRLREETQRAVIREPGPLRLAHLTRHQNIGVDHYVRKDRGSYRLGRGESLRDPCRGVRHRRRNQEIAVTRNVRLVAAGAWLILTAYIILVCALMFYLWWPLGLALAAVPSFATTIVRARDAHQASDMGAWYRGYRRRRR
jgi:hypothetical protein